LNFFRKPIYNILICLSYLPALSFSQVIVTCTENTEQCFKEHAEHAEQLTRQGQYQQAEVEYDIALSLVEMLNEDVAETWANRSVNYRRLGELEKSEISINKAITYFNGPYIYYEKDKEISQLLNNRGLIQRNNKKNKDALTSFQDALLYQDKDSQNHMIMLFNLATQQLIYFKFSEAEVTLNKVISMAERMNQEDRILAMAYAIKARLEHKRGNIEETKKWITKAIAIIENSQEENRSSHADILIEASQYEGPYEAEILLKRAISFYLDMYPNKNEKRMKGYRAYGTFLHKEGRYDEAEQNYQMASENETGKVSDELLADRANNFCDLGKNNRGLNLITEAIKLIENHWSISFDDDPDGREELFKQYAGYIDIKAKCLEANGKISDALDARRESSTIYQNILQSKTTTLNQSYQLKQKIDFRKSFIQHIKLIESLGVIEQESYFEESLMIAQLAQTSVASLAIKEREARSDDPYIKNIESKYQDRLKDLGKVLGELDALNKNSINNEEEINKLQKRKNSIEIALKRSERLLLEVSPGYIEYLTSKPLDLKEIQNKIKPKELVINFISTDKKIFAWGISVDGYYFYSTDSVKNLYENINFLRDAIKKPLTTFETSENLLNKFPFSKSHELYQSLLSPIMKNFSNIDNLLIIPDGRLHRIPFGALLSKNTEDVSNLTWLIEEFAIGIMPSIETITVTFNVPTNNLDESRFVGFGDPLFGNPLITGSNNVDDQDVIRGVIGNFQQIDKLPRLSETRKELNLISNNFKSTNINLFLGESATEKAVKTTNFEKFNIIAFATHAVSTNINSNLTEPSLILTRVSEFNSQNDGILTASDINKLKLNADLVILSACQTANTDIENGQAYTGLAESFFFAGSKAILATHFVVETNSAVAITSGLIRNLNENGNISYSQALRQSVIDLIQNSNRYQHPFYWAPYIIVGNN